MILVPKIYQTVEGQAGWVGGAGQGAPGGTVQQPPLPAGLGGPPTQY